MIPARRPLLLIVLLLFSFWTRGQDTLITKSGNKTGLNLGALPSVLFNSDLGFQYGALANLYQYGDGSLYPDYRWSLYGELARTTKGGGINQLNFDSKYLMPFGIRVTADLSYLTQQALDFYGFNGYQSRYNVSWETEDEEDYISRMFYRIERRLLRMEAAFQKPLGGSPWNVLAGYTFLNLEIGEVDIDALNKGKAADDVLPDTVSLYKLYMNWGLLPEVDQTGGRVSMFKAGVVYDTRDNEPNPMNGIWAEAVVATAPSFLMDRSGWTKLALIYRQYFSLKRNVFSLACRFGYQGTILGSAPWYMQSYMINSMTRSTTVDGLGGGRSLRGILRNRVVGDAVGYANLEFRWKVVRTYWLKQNFYIALSSFLDTGKVLKSIGVDRSKVPEEVTTQFFDTGDDNWHSSIGGGLHIAMNENFVFAVDYGRALDKRDGLSGVYIGLNWLF
ncbi:MAG: hypothetical protein CVU06_05910 [Bacteroidetes bacterium HGW-Bacteroidetes-22]|nr:MAG: hypothetical protein CVU06_05910 [Bacteroidetes bacterium HGW-Bacteroidetes-22]